MGVGDYEDDGDDKDGVVEGKLYATAVLPLDWGFDFGVFYGVVGIWAVCKHRKMRGGFLWFWDIPLLRAPSRECI